MPKAKKAMKKTKSAAKPKSKKRPPAKAAKARPSAKAPAGKSVTSSAPPEGASKNSKHVAVAPPPPPPTRAPAKFRREYKRWKGVLIALRHRLLQEGSYLEEEGLKAIEQEVSVDHMADYGSDSSEQETTLQLIESNSLSLRDVDDALKRIDAGSYGLCEECEALVPSARLAVLPHARLCIACQSKREGAPA